MIKKYQFTKKTLKKLKKTLKQTEKNNCDMFLFIDADKNKLGIITHPRNSNKLKI